MLFAEMEQNAKQVTKNQRYCLSTSQNEIIDSIFDLHLPDGIECDATYGNGMFYKNRTRPKLTFDIDPQFDYVVKADSQMLPIDSQSIKSVMFDPPFLTYIKNKRGHNNGSMVMSKRFGGYYTYSELQDHYIHSISEFYRVLNPGGILVFKCQDIVHNHKLHCTHANVIFWAETEGFRLKDLFVLAAERRMPRIHGEQRHARVNCSYFIVFQKK